MSVHLYSNGAWTDSGKIYRNSLNLFDGTYQDAYISQEGIYIINASAKTTIIPCDGNTTYTIKQYTPDNNHIFRIATFASYPTNNSIGTLIISDNNLYDYTFITGINDKYIAYECAYPSASAPNFTIMVNTGSIALPYEPYNVFDWYDNNGHDYSSGAWA